jgi:hypothetical protein
MVMTVKKMLIMVVRREVVARIIKSPRERIWIKKYMVIMKNDPKEVKMVVEKLPNEKEMMVEKRKTVIKMKGSGLPKKVERNIMIRKRTKIVIVEMVERIEGVVKEAEKEVEIEAMIRAEIEKTREKEVVEKREKEEKAGTEVGEIAKIFLTMNAVVAMPIMRRIREIDEIVVMIKKWVVRAMVTRVAKIGTEIKILVGNEIAATEKGLKSHVIENEVAENTGDPAKNIDEVGIVMMIRIDSMIII